jgi:hypothetical protein
MIEALVAPILSALTRAAAFFAAFFLGKKNEENKNLKEENERFKSSIGLSDSALADKLRKQAADQRDRD